LTITQTFASDIILLGQGDFQTSSLTFSLHIRLVIP